MNATSLKKVKFENTDKKYSIIKDLEYFEG